MTLAARLMPSTGTGRRPTATYDGHGGWLLDDEDAWAVVADGALCKYDPASLSNPVVANQERGELTGRLFVVLATDVARGDLWTMDDGRRLEVLGVEQPGGRSIGGAGGQKVARVLELQPDTTAAAEAAEALLLADGLSRLLLADGTSGIDLA